MCVQHRRFIYFFIFLYFVVVGFKGVFVFSAVVKRNDTLKMGFDSNNHIGC